MCTALSATRQAAVPSRRLLSSAAMRSARCACRTLRVCCSSPAAAASTAAREASAPLSTSGGPDRGFSASAPGAAAAAAAAAVDTAQSYAAVAAAVEDAAHSYTASQVVPFYQDADPTGPGARYRALVLDSSYRPIDVVSWQRAICLDLFDKVDVLEYYPDDTVLVRSAHAAHLVPAVMRVRVYVQRDWKHAKVSLSRRNVMLRDRFCCQVNKVAAHENLHVELLSDQRYCGVRSNLTIDHVRPTSKGGDWSWENLVTACVKCNGKKGDSTLKQLGWKLKKQPQEPRWYEIAVMAGITLSDVNAPPKEWNSYLFPGQIFNVKKPATDAAL